MDTQWDRRLIENVVGSNSTLAGGMHDNHRGLHNNPSRRKPGSEWFLEERECPLAPTSMLLVRIMVGKVVDGNRLVEILRNTPIRQGQPGWNCVFWVRKALGMSVAEWEKVRNEAMVYCQRKRNQHRLDGQGKFVMRKVPTYLDGAEGDRYMSHKQGLLIYLQSAFDGSVPSRALRALVVGSCQPH